MDRDQPVAQCHERVTTCGLRAPDDTREHTRTPTGAGGLIPLLNRKIRKHARPARQTPAGIRGDLSADSIIRWSRVRAPPAPQLKTAGEM
jgi:hypothetical protein